MKGKYKQKLIYLECFRKNEHNGEVLNNVCLDKNCQNQELICSICEQEFHQSHQIIPLKLLLKNLKKDQINLQEQQNIQSLFDSISFSKQRSLQMIKTLQQKLNEKVEQIYENCSNFYLKLKNIINSYFDSGNYSFSIVVDQINQNQYQDANLLYKDFKTLLKIISINEDNQISFKVNFKEVQNEIKHRESQLEKSLDQIIVGLNKSQNDLNFSIFADIQIQQTSTINFKYDPNLKGSTLKILSDNEIQQTENMSSSKKPFAILQPRLSFQHKTSWAMKVYYFQVNKYGGWVGVGVCYKNSLMEKNKLSFNYSSLGHGSYLVSSNGCTWSDSKIDQNSKSKAFKFGEKDIIYQEFDPLTKQLKLCKNGSKETIDNIILDIDLKNDDDLCICVNLYKNNDTVEIINNIQFSF